MVSLFFTSTSHPTVWGVRELNPNRSNYQFEERLCNQIEHFGRVFYLLCLQTACGPNITEWVISCLTVIGVKTAHVMQT